MPDRNARTEHELFQGLDDVEWELLCSAREATVGYIPDPAAWSSIASRDRSHPQPWEAVRDRRNRGVRLP